MEEMYDLFAQHSRDASNNHSRVHNHIVANVAHIRRQSGTRGSKDNIGKRAVENCLVRPRETRADIVFGIGCFSFGNAFDNGKLKVLG